MSEFETNSNSNSNTPDSGCGKHYTLVFCFRTILINNQEQKQILLGFKKRGVGQGLYNGYGGKIDATDKSYIDGARRELQEECGLLAGESLNRIGYLVETVDSLNMKFHIHVYTCTDWVSDTTDCHLTYPNPVADTDADTDVDTVSISTTSNIDSKSKYPEPVETDEMRPLWFNLDAIPFQQMWIDDPYWFPYLLDNIQFIGRFELKREDFVSFYSVTNVKTNKTIKQSFEDSDSESDIE